MTKDLFGQYSEMPQSRLLDEHYEMSGLGRVSNNEMRLRKLHTKGKFANYLGLIAKMIGVELAPVVKPEAKPVEKPKEVEKDEEIYPKLPSDFKNLNPSLLNENDYTAYTSDFFTMEYHKSLLGEYAKYEKNLKEAEADIEKIKGQRGEEIAAEREALNNVVKVAKQKMYEIKRIQGKSLSEQHEEARLGILSLIKKKFVEDKGRLEGAVKDFVLKKLVNKAINEDKVWEFYPTPYEVIDIMVENADIKPGMRILEPSGGKGNILDTLYKEYGDTIALETIEIDDTNRQILKFKGYNIVGGDFLETQPEPIYDRILMNPPFKDTADIDHVKHALKFLKPNGKLIAITSMKSVASKRMPKTIEFRSMIEDAGHFVILPADIMQKAERAATVQIIMSIIDNKKILENSAFLQSEDLDVSELKAGDLLINKTNERVYNILSTNPFSIEDVVTKKTKNFGSISKLIGIFRKYNEDDSNDRELYSGYRGQRPSGSRTIVRGNIKDAGWRQSGLVDARPEYSRTAIKRRLSPTIAKALMPHQVEGVNLALESLEKHGSFILADGTGAGKTFQQLATAHYFLEKEPTKSVVIISQGDDILEQAFKGDAGKLLAKTGIDLNKVIISDKYLLKEPKKMSAKLKPGHIYLFKYKDFSLFDIKSDPLYKKYLALIDERKKIEARKDKEFDDLPYEYRDDKDTIKEINEKYKPELETNKSQILEAEDAWIQAEREYFANVGKKLSCTIMDECHNAKNYLWYSKDKNEQARRAINFLSECPARMFCSATPADRADAIFYLRYAGLFIDNVQMHELLQRIGFQYIEAKYNRSGELLERARYMLPGKYDQSIAAKSIETMFDDLTEEGKMLKREIEMNNITLKVVNIDSGKTAKIVNAKIAQAAADNKKNKTNLYMEQMRAIEPFKVQKAVEIADQQLAKGHSVVIFAGLIAENDEIKEYGGYKGGTVQDIYDIMSRKYGADQVGVVIGDNPDFKYQGGKNRQQTIKDFQLNKKRILIATGKSGGVGINLDDSDQYDEKGKLISEGGFVPRSMIVLTAEMNAEGNVQMIGRINRANTRSRSFVFYLFDMKVVIERWLAGIVERKMMFLNAVVSGQTNKMNIKALDKIKKVHDSEEELDFMIKINEYVDEDDKAKDKIRPHKFFNLKLLSKETTGMNTNIMAERVYQEAWKSYKVTVNTPARVSTKALFENNAFFERLGFQFITSGGETRYKGSVITATFHKDSKNLVLAWNYICNLFLPEQTDYIESEKQLYHIGDKVITNEIIQDRQTNMQIDKGVTGKVIKVRTLEKSAGIYYFQYDLRFEDGREIKRVEQISLKPINFIVELNYKEIFADKDMKIDKYLSEIEINSDYRIVPGLYKNSQIDWKLVKNNTYKGEIFTTKPDEDSFKIVNNFAEVLDGNKYYRDYDSLKEILTEKNSKEWEIEIHHAVEEAIAMFNKDMLERGVLDGLVDDDTDIYDTEIDDIPEIPQKTIGRTRKVQSQEAQIEAESTAQEELNMLKIWKKHREYLTEKFTVVAEYRKAKYTAKPTTSDNKFIEVPMNFLYKGYYNSYILSAGTVNLKTGNINVNAAVPPEQRLEAERTLNSFVEELKNLIRQEQEILNKSLQGIMTMEQIINDGTPNDYGNDVIYQNNHNFASHEPQNANPNDNSSEMPNDGELPKLMSANEITKRDYPQKPLVLNRTKALFTTLLDDAHLFIYGQEGSGKSTFALQMSEDLSKNGNVLYVYAEEKIGERLKRLILRNKIDAPNMMFLPTKDFTEVKEYLDSGKFRFVIIDSHNIIANATQKEMLNLISDYKGISFTFISRMDKEAKKFKGDSDWVYELDTIVKLEDGTAETTKHRDGIKGQKLVVIPKRSYSWIKN